LTIMDLRNRLTTNVVEAIECLHWWIKAGLVSGVLESILLKENEEEDSMDLGGMDWED